MRLLPLFLIVLLLAATGRAEVYRCRDARGNPVFTDDPTKFPDDCRKATAAEKGNLTVVPTKPPAAGQEKARQLIENREARRQRRQQQFADWRERANQLTDDYRTALRQRYHPTRRTQANIREGLKKMNLVSRQKAALLEEMDRKGASTEQRQTIETILRDIPLPGQGES
jgi:hypothetical protein